MKASRRIVVAHLLAAAGLLGWLGYRLANALDIYTYRADFASLPASDDALRGWLAAQPGVAAASVARDGPTVVIAYTMATNGGHPRPDSLKVAERLGYGGLRRYTGEHTSRW